MSPVCLIFLWLMLISKSWVCMEKKRETSGSIFQDPPSSPNNFFVKLTFSSWKFSKILVYIILETLWNSFMNSKNVFRWFVWEHHKLEQQVSLRVDQRTELGDYKQRPETTLKCMNGRSLHTRGNSSDISVKKTLIN